MYKVSNAINPEKTLEFEKGLKITVRGLDFVDEHSMELLRRRQPFSKKEEELNSIEYINSFIRLFIKDVQGVKLEDENGLLKDFKVEFDAGGRSITERSYNVIMKVIMASGPDTIKVLEEAYKELTPEAVVIESDEDKKKD